LPQLAKAKSISKAPTLYEIRRSSFSVYKPKNAKFVILGNSICSGFDWNELFSRDDMVNRSIPGDETVGFLNRLEDIYSLNPRVCIIMGGINDISSGIPTSQIVNNLEKITHRLISHNIKPVILSTLFVSSKRSNKKNNNINMIVKELNINLEKHAQNKKIDYIDMNSILAPHGSLNNNYTHDGIHISGAGLAKWREKLIPVLLKYQDRG
jgi:lysophospholipase L1-like esterase